MLRENSADHHYMILVFILKGRHFYTTVTMLITVEDHKSRSVVWRSRELARFLFTYFDYSNSQSDELA